MGGSYPSRSRGSLARSQVLKTRGSAASAVVTGDPSSSLRSHRSHASLRSRSSSSNSGVYGSRRSKPSRLRTGAFGGLLRRAAGPSSFRNFTRTQQSHAAQKGKDKATASRWVTDGGARHGSPSLPMHTTSIDTGAEEQGNDDGVEHRIDGLPPLRIPLRSLPRSWTRALVIAPTPASRAHSRLSDGTPIHAPSHSPHTRDVIAKHSTTGEYRMTVSREEYRWVKPCHPRAAGRRSLAGWAERKARSSGQCWICSFFHQGL